MIEFGRIIHFSHCPLVFNIFFYTVKTKNRVNPHIQFITVGDTTEFICSSNGTVTWLFQNNELPSNVQLVPQMEDLYHHLKIYNVVPENEGFYQCIIHEGDKYFQDDGLLSVISK